MTDMKPLQGNIRTVAELQRTTPQTGGGFSGCIITERVGRLWKSGFAIDGHSCGLISPTSACMRHFASEHKAVYDAIKCIKQESKSFDAASRRFIDELCDLAFDNVNPKLF